MKEQTPDDGSGFVKAEDALQGIRLQRPPDDWTIVDAIVAYKALDADGVMTLGLAFSDRLAIHPAEMLGILTAWVDLYRARVVAMMAGNDD